MVSEMMNFMKSIPKGASLEHSMDMLLSRVERLGMEAPCVSSDKCQKLMKKYVDPNFNMWDEEYNEQMGEDE